MIEIKSIDFNGLEGAIRAAYLGDYDLIDKFHIQRYTEIEEAVNSELQIISNTSSKVPANFWEVIKDGESIGYFVTLPNTLYSFGINKNHRTEETKVKIWGAIVEIINGNFVCLLYPNNVRAITWLKKCGMVEVPDVEPTAITLLYHKN